MIKDWFKIGFPAQKLPQAKYGLDAPRVVLSLFMLGSIGLIIWGTSAFGLWSGQFLGMSLNKVGLGCGIGYFLGGLAMIWYSCVGKVRSRERLLKLLSWTGNEQVLDVGCGRGLMLVGAANRLTNGRVTGIDIWRAADLSQNSSQGALENARLEGVIDRVMVKTADMRNLPFPADCFDIVLSSAAIHNLNSRADRTRAIFEIVRVLKPGGQVVITDIRHHQEFVSNFAKQHCNDIKRVGSRVISALVSISTFGVLQPTAILVRKPIRNQSKVTNQS